MYEVKKELRSSSESKFLIAQYRGNGNENFQEVTLIVERNEKNDAGSRMVLDRIGIHPNFLKSEFDLVTESVSGISSPGEIFSAYRLPSFHTDLYDLRRYLKTKQKISEQEMLVLFGSLVDQMLSVLTELGEQKLSYGGFHPGKFGYMDGKLLAFDYGSIQILQGFGANKLSISGNPAYQSPESLIDSKYGYSHLHDLYSSGMTLIKAFFGNVFSVDPADSDKVLCPSETMVFELIGRIQEIRCDTKVCEEAKTKFVQFLLASTLHNPVLRAYAFHFFYPDHRLTTLSKQQNVFSQQLESYFTGLLSKATLEYNEKAAFLKLRRLGNGGYGTVYEALRIPRKVDESAVERVALKIYRKPLGDALSPSVPAGIVVLQQNNSLREKVDGFVESGLLSVPLKPTKWSKFYTTHTLGEDADYRLSIFKKKASESQDYSLFLGEVLRFISGVGISLTNLFESGFVHRDIKPSNVLYVDGKYILQDFDTIYSASSRPLFGFSRITSTQLDFTPNGREVIRKWSKPGSEQSSKSVLTEIEKLSSGLFNADDFIRVNTPETDLYLFGMAIVSLFTKKGAYQEWESQSEDILSSRVSQSEFVEKHLAYISSVPCISDCGGLKDKIISVVRSLLSLSFVEQIDGLKRLEGTGNSKVILSINSMREAAVALNKKSNSSPVSRIVDWCKSGFSTGKNGS